MQNPKRLANPQISPISPVLKFDCFEIRQPQNKSIEWPLERIWICAWHPWIIQWKMYSTPNLRSAPSTEETLTSIFGCPAGGGASHLNSVNQIHSNDLKRNPCLPETKRSTRPYQQMQVAKLATCTSQFMFNDGNSNSSLFSNQENESVVLTILKNMKVNGKDDPIYYGKFQTCLKPPTSNVPLANPAWSSFYSPNFQRIRRQTLNDKRHRAPSRVFSRAEMWPSPQKGWRQRQQAMEAETKRVRWSKMWSIKYIHIDGSIYISKMYKDDIWWYLYIYIS